MTDQDYIRAGVELADGFSNHADGTVTVAFLPEAYYLDRLPHPIKDALAAQLVRQVDTLEQKARLMVDWNETIMLVQRGKYNSDRFAIEGTDRTMNTIKAIVDSGVRGKTTKLVDDAEGRN